VKARPCALRILRVAFGEAHVDTGDCATESIASRLSPADPLPPTPEHPQDLAAATEAVHLTDTDRTTRYDSAASLGGTGLAAFDPFSAQIPDDPYPMYRELRDHAPVYRNDERGFWALSRFEDVQWASRDWHAFTSADGVEQDRWGKLLRVSSFIGEDPPRHDQLRSILRKHFVPRRSCGAPSTTDTPILLPTSVGRSV
jgi:hypothetical protein